MEKTKFELQQKEVKPKRVLTTDEASSRKKSSFDLAASIRALHKDPAQRVEDESTKTHYVSKFAFKVNNTLSITKVSLKKDPKKSLDLEVHTLKTEIGEVRTTRAEQIEDITRLAKELEEIQKKSNHEEEDTLPEPCRPREGATIQGQKYPKQMNDEVPRSSVVEGRGADELMGTS